MASFEYAFQTAKVNGTSFRPSVLLSFCPSVLLSFRPSYLPSVLKFWHAGVA